MRLLHPIIKGIKDISHILWNSGLQQRSQLARKNTHMRKYGIALHHFRKLGATELWIYGTTIKQEIQCN
jgi:hypothetical protein